MFVTDQTPDMRSIYINIHWIWQNVHLFSQMRCISMYQHFNIDRKWNPNVTLNPPDSSLVVILDTRQNATIPWKLKGAIQSPFSHHSVDWMAGTFQWPFSDHSVSFSHQSVACQ